MHSIQGAFVTVATQVYNTEELYDFYQKLAFAVQTVRLELFIIMLHM